MKNLFKQHAEVPEQLETYLALDLENGNKTETYLQFDGSAGSFEFKTTKSLSEDIVRVGIKAKGNWERNGLLRALKYAVACLEAAKRLEEIE
jgi:hypothetical protein